MGRYQDLATITNAVRREVIRLEKVEARLQEKILKLEDHITTFTYGNGSPADLCPDCGGGGTCIDSRRDNRYGVFGRHRRRKCHECSTVWGTREINIDQKDIEDYS